MEIVATPPRNMLIIPRPVDPLRLVLNRSRSRPWKSLLTISRVARVTEVGSPGAAGTTWELGSPSQGGPSAANSPVNCFGTNRRGATKSKLMSVTLPAIDLTTATEATLSTPVLLISRTSLILAQSRF